MVWCTGDVRVLQSFAYSFWLWHRYSQERKQQIDEEETYMTEEQIKERRAKEAEEKKKKDEEEKKRLDEELKAKKEVRSLLFVPGVCQVSSVCT